MPRFAAGVVRFQQEVYPEKKELFEPVADRYAVEVAKHADINEAQDSVLSAQQPH